MNIRQWFALALGAALLAGASGAIGQDGSPGPDGLVRVKSSQLDQVYLKPGVDFRRYSKVVFDPAPVTFSKDWLFEMNRHKIAVLQGTTTADADRIANEMAASLRKSFATAFRKAGYETVGAPGADVLALSLGMSDLYLTAPSTVTQALPASRVYTYNAGYGTLALDIRDSATGVLLARFVDRQIAGNKPPVRRGVRATTIVNNQFDFESMFDLWALHCTDELKTQVPMAAKAVSPPNT